MRFPCLYKLVGLLAVIGLGATVSAQDLTLTEFDWVDSMDAPDTLPVFNHLKVGKVPEGMERLDEYAYLLLEVAVGESGEALGYRISRTHSHLGRDVLNIPFEKGAPAQRAGHGVNSTVWTAVIFNPSTAGTTDRNAQPRLLKVSLVVVEEDTLRTVRAKLTVSAQGEVRDIVITKNVSSWVEAAVKRALRTWVFAPGRSDGCPVDMQIEVPVLLKRSAELLPPAKLDHQPVPISQKRPVYPHPQLLRDFVGEVVVDFVVDIEGRVSRAYVKGSNNPVFDEAALSAVLKWRFKPAELHGGPISCRMRVPVIFKPQGGGGNAFTVQTEKRFQETLPTDFRFDTAPQLVNFQPSVYPYEALLAQKGGAVQFMFAVDSQGQAALVKIFSSPGDDFSEAIRAMVDAMRFDPALQRGKPTNALLRMDLKFSEWHGDISLSDSTSKLVAELRKMGSGHIVTLSDLEKLPEPTSQKAPEFPRALRGKCEAGQALVEFFIDEHGIAQLPHIVSASDPAFGYAACQAVASWRFTPPMQDGRPVVVRARIPIEFSLK